MDEIKASEAKKLIIEIENCKADLNELNKINTKYAGIRIFSNENYLSLSSLNDSEILDMFKSNIKHKLELATNKLNRLLFLFFLNYEFNE